MNNFVVNLPSDASIMGYITWAWGLFLTLFPLELHWLVSLIVLISLAAGFFMLIKNNWFWVLILIILIPASIPIFRTLFSAIWEFIKMLIAGAKLGPF